MAKNQEDVGYVTFGHGCSASKMDLLEIFKEIPFDMQLISSNHEKIAAHYTVLAMFSNYFRNYFNETPFSPGMAGNILDCYIVFASNSVFNCHFLSHF